MYTGLLLTPLKDSVLVNLIPYNPTEVKEDYHAPTQSDIQAFHTILITYDIHTRIRHEMGQDIASACGQLVLKKQDNNNKTNKTTTNCNSTNSSNDKKSNYNTSIEIEDFISKQQAKLTHATYNTNNNNTTTNTTNNNTTTNTNRSGNYNNSNQIYQRNKPPPYPLKRKKTGSSDLTLPNPNTGPGEKDDDQSGDRNQAPAYSAATTTSTTTTVHATTTSEVGVSATGLSKKSSVICGVVLTAMYLYAYIMTAGN